MLSSALWHGLIRPPLLTVGVFGVAGVVPVSADSEAGEVDVGGSSDDNVDDLSSDDGLGEMKRSKTPTTPGNAVLSPGFDMRRLRKSLKGDGKADDDEDADGTAAPMGGECKRGGRG